MKIPLLAICLTVSLAGLAQNNKWFVSVSSGVYVGGPVTSIKKQMRDQGFDDVYEYNFFGFAGTDEYPSRTQTGGCLLRAGKKLDEKKAVYVVAGLVDQSTVSGFKSDGTDYSFFLIGGSYGDEPEIKYSLWQLSAGYMYSSNKRAKLGIAPSLFFLNYTLPDSSKHTGLMPGATFTGRFPLGKEKRLFGVDLILEVNLVPPVKMKETKGSTRFNTGSVNMVGGFVGLGYTFRRK